MKRSAIKNSSSEKPIFLQGARLVVEAMLQSPNFLFRLDDASDFLI
jgi:hypothetical protein